MTPITSEGRAGFRDVSVGLDTPGAGTKAKASRRSNFTDASADFIAARAVAFEKSVGGSLVNCRAS